MTDPLVDEDYVVVRLPLRLRVVELEQIKASAERQLKQGLAVPSLD